MSPMSRDTDAASPKESGWSSIPFSLSSMAHAMVAPHEMVSSPSSLHAKFDAAMDERS